MQAGSPKAMVSNWPSVVYVVFQGEIQLKDEGVSYTQRGC